MLLPELINKLNKGDSNTYEHLFKYYYPRLAYYSEQIIGDNINVDDIVGDTLYLMWENRKNFHSHNELKNYLYLTVKNKSLNYIKHNIVKNKYNQLHDNEESDTNFEDLIIEQEVHGFLHYALNNLPKECAKIIDLIYIKGLKYQEVADELGVSIDTVKSQRKRAIEILKNKFMTTTKSILYLFI